MCDRPWYSSNPFVRWIFAACGLAFARRLANAKPQAATSVSKFANESRGRFGHQFPRQLDWLSTKSADRLHNLQQISTIAGTRTASLDVVAFIQKVHGVWAT